MSKTMKKFIDNLMAQMTIEEKIGQLNMMQPDAAIETGVAVNEKVEQKIREGKVGMILNVPTPYKVGAAAGVHAIQTLAIEQSRLKIPVMFWLDIIHGHKTVFPIGAISSWDTDLIEETARIEALEGTADGYHGTFSPMVDVVRDPRWGRVAESLCEDPYLASQMAVAKVKGYQGDDLSQPGTLMACVKHFAAYGAAEAGRDYNTVDMSEMKLHEIYLPPFKAGLDVGAGSLMAAFNDLNGVPCHGNKMLMTDTLRKKWRNNSAITIGDFTGDAEMVGHGLGNEKEVALKAFKAGLDVTMVSELYSKHLPDFLAEGKVTEAEIDAKCRRVLEAKYRLGLFEDPYRGLDVENARSAMLLPEYRQIAREAAAKTCILLQNNNQALPLKAQGTIALIGPLADDQLNMHGTWSVGSAYQDAVGLREGLQKAVGDKGEILYAKGANVTNDPVICARINRHGMTAPIDERSPEEMLAEALDIAQKSDVIVAVLGEAKEQSGESASFANIDLQESQKTLLTALKATGKPIVLVMMSGRPLTIEAECKQADAVLQTWFGGTEAGNGIADVLLGHYNPSGKLTMSFPRNVGQIPLYYNQRTTGRLAKAGDFESFKSCYIDSPHTPLFPFGHGLSYTTFDYGAVKIDKATLRNDEVLKATVTITNTGAVAGEEVVQLYIQDPVATATRPVKDLKGFQKISLQPGESKDVTFEVTPELLKFVHPDLKRDWEGGEFIIHIGRSSADTNTASVQWDKDISVTAQLRKEAPELR